jgi:GAF domain-containing protein
VTASAADPTLAGVGGTDAATAMPRPRARRVPVALKLTAAFLGLVALVLIVNGGLSLWLNYEEAKRTALRVQQEMAHAATERIDGFVSAIESQIGWTTRQEWRRIGVEQQRYDFIRLLRQAPAITEVSYIDGTGREQLKVSRLAPDAVGSNLDLSGEPRFARAVADRVWFGPIYFRRGSEPYMTIAVAHAGRDAGVTAAEVNLKLIWDVLAAIRVGRNGYAYVVDANGRLIAHPDMSLVLRDTDLSRLPQVAAAMSAPRPARPDAQADPAGTAVIGTGLDGSAVLTAHDAIGRLGWIVLVQLPVTEALAPVYTSLAQTGMLLALGIVLALVAGTFLARRMVLPIHTLQQGAERLGEGDLSQRIAIRTGDEIETLADRFNQMASRIQESYETLEAKVEERTRDLNEALQQQTATAEVLKVISRSAFDLQTVLDTLVGSAASLCDADSAFLFRREGDVYRWGAAFGFSDERFQALKAHMAAKTFTPGRESVLTRTALEGGPVHILDVLDDPEYAWGEVQRIGGIRTALGVPLLRNGETVGVLTMTRSRVQAFADRQIELAATFADQAVIAIENVRLFEEVQARTGELQETLEFQTAASNVLNVISRSPSELQPVLDTIVQTAASLCAAEYAFVAKHEDGRCRLVAANNMEAEHIRYLADNPVAIDRSSVTGRVALERRTIHVDDVLADPEFGQHDWQRVGRQRTVLGVPLLRDGSLIGVIILARTAMEPFSAKQVELVTTFADQAVIAIANVRLFEEVQARTAELQESLDYQTATSEVLGVISRSPDSLQPVLNAIVAIAARICEATVGDIVLAEGDRLRVAAAIGDMARPVEKVPLDRTTVMGRSIVDCVPVHVDDLLAAGEDFPLGQRLAARYGHRTILAVPLVRDGRALGTILLRRGVVQPFSAKQVTLLKTFADQAVIAINNVGLFEEVQARTAELSEALQQQTATAEVLKVISRSAFDLQPVLDTLIESAIKLGGGTRGSIFFKDGDVLRLKSHYGHTQEHAERLTLHPLRIGMETMAGRPALLSQTVHVPDVLADPDFRNHETLKTANFRAFLGVPLMRHGAVFGVLAMHRPEPGPFSPRQIELVNTFADQAVIAINNVGLFEEVQARTRELQEALEFQTATGDVLGVISRSPNDLQPVLDTIVCTALDLCQAEYAVFWKRGEDGLYHVAAGKNVEAVRDIDWLRSNPIAKGDGTATGLAALEGETIHFPDVLEDPRFTAFERLKRSKARTQLAVPLMGDGDVAGVIFLARTEPKPFTPRQIDLVTTFADQAVIAINNVGLFEEVQARTRELSESLRQQTATADVLKVISRSAFDLQPVLDTLAESAARLCEADKGVIFQRDGDVYRLAANHGFSPQAEEYAREHPLSADRGSVTGRVALEGRTVHIPDVLADPEYRESGYQSAFGYRTNLGVPLLREGAIIGVFVLTRDEVRPFTDKQVELVTTFADQAVIAIENARLFEEVQARTRELAQSLNELRAAQDRLVQSEKLASLGQLTAGIAHEIKNPLNFVNNFAEVSTELVGELREALAPAPLAAEVRAEVDDLTGMIATNLAKVVEHGRRADSIVKNMLLHSREGTGERRSVDLNATVEESLNLAYHGARAERPGFNITMQKDLDPGLGSVDIYPQEFIRVLLNLIANGFYAAHKKKAERPNGAFEPTLAIATRGYDDRVEIRIRDNGAGIPDEVKAKIFNPFFTTKPAGEGTGLGLSLSYDIVVKQHGGTIDVDTRPGEFTEFVVTLPRAQAAGQVRRAAS